MRNWRLTARTFSTALSGSRYAERRVMEEAHIHPAGTHGVVAGRRGTIIGHSVIEDHVLDARPQLVYIVRFDHGHGAYLRESDAHGPCYISTLVADPSSFNADADDREHWDETDEVE